MQVARLLLFLLMLLSARSAFAFSLVIHWQFTHVVNGYDRDNRLEVFLDGKPAATSETYKQSAVGEVCIDVPAGKHLLTVSDLTCYKGNWERTTVENDYALDASFTKVVELDNDAGLNVTFNIERARTTVKMVRLKKTSAEPAAAVSFSVSWSYVHAVADYTYQNRLAIYIDGKRVAESYAVSQSVLGSVSFSLPAGTYDLRFQTEVLYDGKWEEQVRQFDYAIDGFYELERFSVNLPVSLHLTFDMESGAVIPGLNQ